jgi:S-methylmethionine-dependent homocysteine/selenocysteine methylase
MDGHCAEIHLDYARAGARILIPTFRTTLRALGKAGRGGDWRSFNEQAVACARSAAESVAGTCLVAGGIAPLEECYSPDLVPDDDDCLAEHRRQIELLASLGVDLIVIETMNSEREARAALVAARESGLDVLQSLCPRTPAHLLSGEALADVVPRLVDEGGASLRGILLNCASPDVLEVVYPRFASLVPAPPHGVYAHLGEPDANVGWRLPEQHEPERYADWVERRLTEGARIVGGCCGTTPAHTRAVAERIRS